jgi:hypothetical protein
VQVVFDDFVESLNLKADRVFYTSFTPGSDLAADVRRFHCLIDVPEAVKAAAKVCTAGAKEGARWQSEDAREQRSREVCDIRLVW